MTRDVKFLGRVRQPQNEKRSENVRWPCTNLRRSVLMPIPCDSEFLAGEEKVMERMKRLIEAERALNEHIATKSSGSSRLEMSNDSPVPWTERRELFEAHSS